eukprot:559487-Amorphochlora_amoeboformis.AAC.1
MASCHRPPAVLLQPSRRLGVKPFLLIILVGTLALAGSSLPRRNGDMGRAVSQLHSRARVQEGVRLWRRATPSEILRRGTIKIRADMSGRDGGAKEKKIRELGVEAKTGADRGACEFDNSRYYQRMLAPKVQRPCGFPILKGIFPRLNPILGER